MALTRDSGDGSDFSDWVRSWVALENTREYPDGPLDPLFLAGAVTERMPMSRRRYAAIITAFEEMSAMGQLTDDHVVDWITTHFDRRGRQIASIERRDRN